MDRNSLLGIILITLVLLIWMWYNAPRAPERNLKMQDTLEIKKQLQEPGVVQAKGDTFGVYFSHLSRGEEKKILIETDLYTCVISSKGALIEKFELKKFKTWNGYPVQLVDMNKGGDFSLLFMTTDGKIINTRNLYFNTKARHWENFILKKKGEKVEIEFTLDINDSSPTP